MKKRLFLYTALIMSAGLLCFFAASVYITYHNNISMAKDAVMETARIYAEIYDDADRDTFIGVASDTRITVIAPDGGVLADSRPLDVGSMENHLTRPEVQAALNGAPSAYVRYSKTLGANLIYYALKTEAGAIIRAAIPVAKTDAYLFQSLPLLALFLLIVTALCFAFSRRIINKFTKPFEAVAQKLRLLSNGAYTPEPVAKTYEEIDAITKGMDGVARVLQESFVSLRDEKGKAEYILNNISDGIFAVDGHKSIALINAAALGIFDAAPGIVGKNISYLLYDRTFTAALEDCAAYEKSALFEISLDGRTYLVTVKRLPETTLVMAILSDITDRRENEKQREDFFANASHELKTPLTAIKGFAELTAINNKDAHIQKYVEGIARETDRMLALIGDMLKLSELENARTIEPVPLSLANVLNEACETLSASVREKGIELAIAGNLTVEAEARHVYELVKNILENAVRYNHPNGKVSVTVDGDKNNARLSVLDNGIGISPEEQTRIFERFYRVEKSRSGRGGGTGLGLSIAKHICALYGWKLSLKSKLGVGTEVIVEFGKP